MNIYPSVDRILVYEDIYTREYELEYFFDKLPFEHIVRFASLILSKDFAITHDNELLWLICDKKPIYNQIAYKISKVKSKYHIRDIKIFSELSVLGLLDFALKNQDKFSLFDFDNFDNFDDFYTDLFKLNLIFNQVLVEKQDAGVVLLNETNIDFDLQLHLIYSFPQIEYTMYDSNYYRSIVNVKMKHLISFLEKTEKWNKLKESLYKRMNFDNSLDFHKTFFAFIEAT